MIFSWKTYGGSSTKFASFQRVDIECAVPRKYLFAQVESYNLCGV